MDLCASFFALSLTPCYNPKRSAFNSGGCVVKRVLVDGTYLALQMKGVGRYTLNTLRQLSLIPPSPLDTALNYQILVREGAPLPPLPSLTPLPIIRSVSSTI